MISDPILLFVKNLIETTQYLAEGSEVTLQLRTSNPKPLILATSGAGAVRKETTKWMAYSLGGRLGSLGVDRMLPHTGHVSIWAGSFSVSLLTLNLVPA